MGRRSRPLSVFSSLPPQIKYQLRSQPTPPTPAPTAHIPNPSDLLPTQPQDSDDDSDSDDADDDDEHVVLDSVVSSPSGPSMTGAFSSSSSIIPSVPTHSAVVIRKRAASIERQHPNAHAHKRHKGKGKDADNSSNNSLEGHAWDCTGLVPRYTAASDVPAHLKKYFFQRHSLWPAYSRLPLLMDDTGWFSVTPASIAAHIADRCRCDVILDAFCGVGGNAIAFAKTCEKVIAMDIDITRLRLARHNALHHGVADRIEFVLCDYVQWVRTPVGAAALEAIDVVFLSPPWGGPEYLSVGDAHDGEHPQYPLSAILPIPGDELFRLTAAISPNIAYFLPRNSDIDELAALAAHLPAPQQDSFDGSDRTREWVEIEEEWVGDKLKAITAYYGGLVAGA